LLPCGSGLFSVVKWGTPTTRLVAFAPQGTRKMDLPNKIVVVMALVAKSSTLWTAFHPLSIRRLECAAFTQSTAAMADPLRAG
jgi:hypothetical protein